MDSPYIILNPAAGSGRATNFLELVRELPGNPIIKLTTRPGEGEELARAAVAQGHRTIVAGGGDGLINEVVNGLIDRSQPESRLFHKDIRFGVLPLGTMNVFATELKLPLDSIEEAWNVILEQHTQYVDLPKVVMLGNGDNARERFFVQLAGAGLDAQILIETSRESKQFFGPISYLLTFLKIATRKTSKIFLRCEEHTKENGSFLLLGNGKFYGGAFPFFSEGSLQDGLLHVLLFKHHNLLELLGNIPSLLLGRARDLHTVKYFKTTSLLIEPQDPIAKIPFELDGEMIAYLPIKITLDNNKLSVLVPARG